MIQTRGKKLNSAGTDVGYNQRLMIANKRFITVPHQLFYVKPSVSGEKYEEFHTADAYVQEQYGIDWIRITPLPYNLNWYTDFTSDNDATHYSDYYDVYVDDIDIPPMPELEYESYDIQQCESTSVTQGHYKDITITVKVFSFGDDLMNFYPTAADKTGSFQSANVLSGGSLSAWNEFINSGKQLVTSHSSEYYYIIKQVGGYEWKHVEGEKYSAEIKFTCSPFKYRLDNTCVSVSSGQSVSTAATWGNADSYPLIVFHHSGSVTINNTKITISKDVGTSYADERICVDCQTGEVYRTYYSGMIKSLDYTGFQISKDFPVIQHGVRSSIAASDGAVADVYLRERFI